MLNIFTIALNELDNLRQQYKIIEQLKVPWRWCVVTGYAKPVKDTAWCKDIEPPSDDVGIAFLKDLALHDSRVYHIGKPQWEGKTEQVNAALEELGRPWEKSVLMQIDADEFWHPWQLEKIHEYLITADKPMAMQFDCRFWVGPRRYVWTRGKYGDNYYEWFRAWSWTGKQRFLQHEPPNLDGNQLYYPDSVTEEWGLVFEHRAYTDEARVAFKEKYYGYRNLLKNWKELNAHTGPCIVSAGVFGNAQPFLTVEA